MLIRMDCFGLRQLLFDYNWLQAQLNANGINGLLADYDWLTDDKTLRLLQSTLRLSAHVLTTKPQQLNQRLWGHLRDRQQPDVDSLLNQGAAQQQSIWLRPQKVNLTAPDGPMIRTLEGRQQPDVDIAPGSRVNSVVMSADGSLALSGSDDNTLKLWGLTTGKCLATFCSDHPFYSCALSADGSTIVAGDAAGTVHFFSVIEPGN